MSAPQAISTLSPLLYENLVERELAVDLGQAGDLTSDAVVPQGAKAVASIHAREPGCIAGLAIAAHAFCKLDPSAAVGWIVQEGAEAAQGQELMQVQGLARPLLSAERTALNFLGRLSGIASATRRLVRAVEGTDARIVCTRKTTPGLRALEKYAVRAGGGSNHRFGLCDAVLIKDNHLVVAGSVAEAVRRVRSSIGHLVKVEVEVDTLEQLEEALQQPIDAVMLDNMDPVRLRQAVHLARRRVLVEVSGGITPETAAEAAAAGADLISVGWLTHSSPALDVALDFHPA